MVGGEENCATLVPNARIIRQNPWRDSTSIAEVGSSRKTNIGITCDRDGEADPLGLTTRKAVGSLA